MPRYICEPLNSIGQTRPGTLGVMVRHYRNGKNAMRWFAHHLKANHILPGQYRVSTWPEDQYKEQEEVGTLYKKA